MPGKRLGGMRRATRKSAYDTAARAIQGAWRAYKSPLGSAVRQAYKSASRKFLGVKTESKAQEFGVAGPGSESHTDYGSRPSSLPKKMEMHMTKQFFTLNSAANVTWNIAEKEYACPAKVFDGNDLATIFGFVASNNSKIVFRSCNWEVMLSNPTTALQRVNIYDIAVRRSHGTASADPAAVLKNSFSDFNKNGGTQVNSAYKQIGLTPFQNPAFTTIFKVLKQTPLLMQGGQVHSHKCKWIPNKWMDKEEYTWTANTATNGVFRDFTVFTMIECYGTPENDSTTKTQVSLGEGRINFSVVKSYDYVVVDRSAAEIDFTQSLPTAFTVGAQIAEIAGAQAQGAPLV